MFTSEYKPLLFRCALIGHQLKGSKNQKDILYLIKYKSSFYNEFNQIFLYNPLYFLFSYTDKHLKTEPVLLCNTLEIPFDNFNRNNIINRVKYKNEFVSSKVEYFMSSNDRRIYNIGWPYRIYALLNKSINTLYELFIWIYFRPRFPY